MPVANTSSSTASIATKNNRRSKVINLSGGGNGRSSGSSRVTTMSGTATAIRRDDAVSTDETIMGGGGRASGKALREARFQSKYGSQGLYDEGLDVEIDRDDVHEIAGEAFEDLREQRVLKEGGGASKATCSYQSKPKSVRM